MGEYRREHPELKEKTPKKQKETKSTIKKVSSEEEEVDTEEVSNWRKKRENLFDHFLPIWLLSALYIMVKRERPCTTPCLFKAHPPTAHSPGLIPTSTRIQPSLP